GITRMALRKVLETPDTYDILIAVKNFSTQPMEVPLQVTAILRKPLLERRLQLQPGQEEVIVSTLTGPLKGIVQAEIAVEDDFPLDNRAYGVVAAPTQLGPSGGRKQLFSRNVVNVVSWSAGECRTASGGGDLTTLARSEPGHRF